MGSMERPKQDRRKLDFHPSIVKQKRSGPREGTVSLGNKVPNFLEEVGLSWVF